MSYPTFHESFRRLVAMAQRYVRGEAALMEYYYACVEAQRDVLGTSPDRRISELVGEWSSLAERCRNEWGLSAEPLSEDQLKEHLRRALSDLGDEKASPGPA